MKRVGFLLVLLWTALIAMAPVYLLYNADGFAVQFDGPSIGVPLIGFSVLVIQVRTLLVIRTRIALPEFRGLLQTCSSLPAAF